MINLTKLAELIAMEEQSYKTTKKNMAKAKKEGDKEYMYALADGADDIRVAIDKLKRLKTDLLEDNKDD